ncbi:MAG: Xaa-Pro peptidase family protein [Actinomycetota bacterium]
MSTPSSLPPLVAMDVAGRATRVREALAEHGAAGLLVTKPANVRWLTGFTGSNSHALVTADRLMVATDGRYRTQIADELDAAGVEAEVEIVVAALAGTLQRAIAPGERVGLEADHVTWSKQRVFAEAWPDRELVPTIGLVEELRKHKDAGERSRLERAAAMADVALAEVAPTLGSGRTEREVARHLDSLMIEQGADGPSYDTIVASGPNGALPHARPTDRVIEAHDLVVIDVGARLDGYGSDMTRTFVAGAEPTERQRRLWDAVRDAQAAGVAAVADGVEIRHVDAVCRDVLARHDLAEFFIHGTGHGIGLEIHEDPILSARTDGILRAGYVVTVEPGVYIAGEGGVRIEDAVVVHPSGCEPITHSPKTPSLH